ncbi:CopG-like DNA-binding protein (plasmid) [Planktothrix tepida]|uniref:CopG-like DNA-binding protein n=1 Tax=Planktothrix tepida PCC 9214 TaxID=671072 RepID=A0A1J1LN66_9CYAN|nr:hypothetical protein [Planktothrix tepida]CAD5988383.1 CopG-like DNA-binding protein [Planktothrix tepida]CUR33931.1 CopG-like DNA-binding protein [Planktothrix tepida PCC 9214]
MNRKQSRKPLTDALAKEFVYGRDEGQGARDEKVSITPAVTPEPIATVEASEPESTPEPTPQPTPQQQLTMMDKLQFQPKEGTKRFTVDLAESTHRKLSMLAARTGRTKAEIVRLLLEDALKDVQE